MQLALLSESDLAGATPVPRDGAGTPDAYDAHTSAEDGPRGGDSARRTMMREQGAVLRNDTQYQVVSAPNPVAAPPGPPEPTPTTGLTPAC